MLIALLLLYGTLDATFDNVGLDFLFDFCLSSKVSVSTSLDFHILLFANDRNIYLKAIIVFNKLFGQFVHACTHTKLPEAGSIYVVPFPKPHVHPFGNQQQL